MRAGLQALARTPAFDLQQRSGPAGRDAAGRYEVAAGGGPLGPRGLGDDLRRTLLQAAPI